MFCKFCGNKVDENSVFCQKCGKEVNAVRTTTPPPQTGTSKKSETGKYITEAKFNPSGMIGLQVLDTIFMIAGILFLIFANTTQSYRSFINLDNKELFITLGTIIIIASIIGMISALITVAINSDIKCIVYENKVIGKAVNSRWSVSRVDFSLNYNEIDNVDYHGKIITITSNGVSYIVAASTDDQAGQVVREIQARASKGLSKPIGSKKWKCPKCGITNIGSGKCEFCGTESPISITSSYLNESNTWCCPKCGQINSSYVGTCGCGTRKPR